MFNVSAWEASGLTIKALAEAAGVSFSTAWRWIHAGSKPSPLARKKLQKLGLWLHQRKPSAADVKRAVTSRDVTQCHVTSRDSGDGAP
jgi:transcriptional regulator with XRE-family HTH domain